MKGLKQLAPGTDPTKVVDPSCPGKPAFSLWMEVAAPSHGPQAALWGVVLRLELPVQTWGVCYCVATEKASPNPRRLLSKMRDATPFITVTLACSLSSF